MSQVGRYTVAFDATPLSAPPESVSSHTMRGIGRYIGGLLDALTAEQPSWANDRLRPVITAADGIPAAGQPIVTRRVAWRRQDLGWWTAWALDVLALGRERTTLWHGLDPNSPLSPLPAGRTVMTAYDLIALHEPAAMAQIRRHRRAVYSLYLRRLRSARLVTAISEATAWDVQRTLGVPKDRIRIVYPAIKPGPRGPSTDSAERDAPDLLFVGVPEPTKQPELAIGTLAECRRRGLSIRLRFAGYQRPADRARLEALAVAAGVGEAVQFLGRIDDGRLTALYRQSVLLAVSRLEGFGLPPVESLFAGGRVVAGSAPVYREVLGDAADYAGTIDATGFADAYEFAAARPAADPPPALVERYSARATAAALIGAYDYAAPPA